MIALIAAVLVLGSWWHDPPELIAIHWSATGQPDGFSSVGGAMGWLTGIGVFVALVAIWAALATSPFVVRLIVPMMAGAGASLLTFQLATVAPQRGMADATTVTLPGWAFLWGAVAGVAGGLITLWLLPRWTSEPLNGVRPADAGTLGDAEGAVWTQVVIVATPGVVVASAATLLVVAATVIAGVWWMLPLAVLLVLTMVATLSVRVVVDASGLRIAGRLGWPRVRIDVANIESVATADVHALREFGG